MRFFDQGIIINIYNYQDNSAIIKLLTKDHGICCGFVKNAKSKKVVSLYQIGNLLSFEYRNRIDESLGNLYNVDIKKSHLANIIFEPLKLEIIKLLFYIFDKALLEREEQRILFDQLIEFFNNISCDNISYYDLLAKYIKLELKILEILGYGIELDHCVVTNSIDNLVFISPKSAKAVCYEVGKLYEKKLLVLPKFLIDSKIIILAQDLINGIKLTGYFLTKNFFLEDRNFYNLRKNITKKI